MQDSRRTTVSIQGNGFLINGKPTYPGVTYQGRKIEGLLLNSRMVQGIFDDLNPETREMWDYPDGPWNPDRNTDEFVASMPAWRQAGLLAFTLNLQGGNPRGYGQNQPWHNSVFKPDGTLDPAYMVRLEKILDKADQLGMAVILGYFYFGQDQRLIDECSVIQAVDNATTWLRQRAYTNVLVEIGNEVDNRKYDRDIIKAHRCQELMDRVKRLSASKVNTPAGRFLVSASLCGNVIPPDNIVKAADFLLIHGNGVREPDRIREMVDICRGLDSYKGQPVLFNEDDHYNFDADDNNFLAAIDRYASWGYFDFRMTGEGYNEGYQSVPVNWGISSARKHGFFNLLATITCAGDSG
jgi:hypothetical protein